MPRTTTRISQAPFIADPEACVRTLGRQVDWSKVTADSDGVKRLAAGKVVGYWSNKIAPVSYSATVTASVSSNVVTVTLANHGLSVGDEATISGATPAAINGTFTVASVPTANTFTYAATADDGAASGTITLRVQAAGILETAASDAGREDSLSGYGVLVGGRFFEALLPDATGTPRTLPAGYKTELEAHMQHVGFEPYSDTRAS